VRAGEKEWNNYFFAKGSAITTRSFIYGLVFARKEQPSRFAGCDERTRHDNLSVAISEALSAESKFANALADDVSIN
jgi:hypothetical protein